MADIFRDRSCMRWWLPNDENYPPIIRSIRKFVEERTSPAKNMPAEDLRDMKAIFAKLNLDDGKSKIPPVIEQGTNKGTAAEVAVASSQDSYIGHDQMQGMALEDGDAFRLEFR